MSEFGSIEASKYIGMGSLRRSVTVYYSHILCLWHHCHNGDRSSNAGIIKWGLGGSSLFQPTMRKCVVKMKLCGCYWLLAMPRNGEQKQRKTFFYRTIKVSGFFIIQTFIILFKLHINSFLLLEKCQHIIRNGISETGKGSVSYPKYWQEPLWPGPCGLEGTENHVYIIRTHLQVVM